MTNLDFPTLQPFQPGNSAQAPAKKRRAAKPKAPAVSEPKQKKPRAPKPAGKAGKKPKQPREMKLSASAVFDMMGRGLKPADVVALQQVAGVLASLPKRSRGRIVAALTGMFA